MSRIYSKEEKGVKQEWPAQLKTSATLEISDIDWRYLEPGLNPHRGDDQVIKSQVSLLPSSFEFLCLL